MKCLPRSFLVIIATLLGVGPASAEGPAPAASVTPAFVAQSPADFTQLGAASMARYSTTKVTGQTFDWALRVQVLAQTAHAYDVQVLTKPGNAPLKKGDVLLAVVNVRCPDAPAGAGIFSARLQGSASPWTEIGAMEINAGREWKRFYIPGRVGQDFAPGKYILSLQLGTQTQTLEFGGIALLNLGAAMDISKLPVQPISYPGEEPDAPWRKAAAERIEKYRKASLKVRVVDRTGQPVAGAAVHVQMLRQAFGFGTFLEYRLVTGTGPESDQMRAWTLKLFNRCTTPIFWADWGWANPQERQAYLAAAQWAADNHLDTRGHCIIYPGWQFMPASLKALANHPPELQRQLLQQVAAVTDATRKFRFAEYDVCNELRDLTEVPGLLGREAVVAWFKTAREHAPDSAMGINENTILTRGGATQREQDNYAGWIQYLIDQGQGPDVIGLQSHFGDAVTGPETVLRILDRFATFGKPLQITEFDLVTRDEAGQARYTRDFLTAVFSHPATTAFTIWGFWEGRMWQPPGALVRKDWTLKPNGQVWLDLVRKEWWTDVILETGPDGTCVTRGFLGDYRITAARAGKETAAPAKLAQPGLATELVLD